MGVSGNYGSVRPCAGIVGYADLTLGTEVLEGHLERAPGRFKGVRYITEWDADKSLSTSPVMNPVRLADTRIFRDGFSCLSEYGLTFDAWLFYHQLPDIARLARDYPDTPIIINHAGAPLNVGAYSSRQDEVIAEWRRHLKFLATHDNVYLKVGGFNMEIYGLQNAKQSLPPSSEMLASQWRNYVEICLEAFGTERCMFESNFPVDKAGCSYSTLWNAFKRLTLNYSDSEKQALYRDNAARLYRL